MVEPVAMKSGINWAWAYFNTKEDAEAYIKEERARAFARGDEYRADIQGQVQETYTDRMSGAVYQKGWWVVHYHY